MVSYGQHFAPDKSGGEIILNVINEANGRVIDYCVLHKLPILTTLIVNKRAF
jgi:hypothetical protein